MGLTLPSETREEEQVIGSCAHVRELWLMFHSTALDLARNAREGTQTVALLETELVQN